MVRLPPGSGWAEAWLFARQRGVRGAVVQPPRAEPVLWPTLRAQGGHPWRGQRGPSWGVLGQEAGRPRVNTRKSFPRSLGTESWDALWGCQGADRLRTGSLLVACSRCGSRGLRAGRAGALGRPLGLWLLQPSPRVQPSLPPPLRAGLAPRGWSNHHEPLSSWSPPLEGPVTVLEPEGVPTAAPRPVLRLTPPPPGLHARPWWRQLRTCGVCADGVLGAPPGTCVGPDRCRGEGLCRNKPPPWLLPLGRGLESPSQPVSSLTCTHGRLRPRPQGQRWGARPGCGGRGTAGGEGQGHPQGLAVQVKETDRRAVGAGPIPFCSAPRVSPVPPRVPPLPMPRKQAAPPLGSLRRV